MTEELLPWQQSCWTYLNNQRIQDRLPHALLLSGPEGLGKLLFARKFAQALLCKQPRVDGMACQQCRACKLFVAETHPDLLQVTPEEDGKAIKIDQIRELIDCLGLTTQYGGYKIVILCPADHMNTHAANSLLKTLEEPSINSLLLLISANPSRLPATIRSRCQDLRFTIPPPEQAQAWLSNHLASGDDPSLCLSLASGAPVMARAMAASDASAQRQSLIQDLQALTEGGDPVKITANWLKLGSALPLYWLYGCVADMIRLKIAGMAAQITNSDIREVLQGWANQFEIMQLYAVLDRILEARRLTHTQVNDQMLLESILLYWSSWATSQKFKKR